MKTTLTILLALFLGSSVYAATELEWVDEQIEAIKPPRKGVNITALGSPFVFLEKNKPEKEGAKKGTRATAAPAKKAAAKTASSEQTDQVAEGAPKKSGFVLSTIINKSAMIDGNWYKVSDNISSYTVTDITKTSVTLKQGNKELVLSTASTNPNLKFKNK